MDKVRGFGPRDGGSIPSGRIFTNTFGLSS